MTTTIKYLSSCHVVIAQVMFLKYTYKQTNTNHTNYRWWLLWCSTQAPPPHSWKWVVNQSKSGTTTITTLGIFFFSFFLSLLLLMLSLLPWRPSVMSSGAQCFFVHHALLLSLLLQHPKLLLQDLHHHGWVGCQVEESQLEVLYMCILL